MMDKNETYYATLRNWFTSGLKQGHDWKIALKRSMRKLNENWKYFE